MYPWLTDSLDPPRAPSLGPISLLFVTEDSSDVASFQSAFDGLDFDVEIRAMGVTRAADLDFEDLDGIVCTHDPPVVDGLALVREVRDEAPVLPFVLFPDDGSEQLASDALAAGVSDYVPDTGADNRWELLATRVRDAVATELAATSYHEVFENVDIGLTVRDLESGRLVDVNRYFCELLGYDREEALELDFDAISADVPGYSTDRMGDLLREASEVPGQTIEWPDRTKDGELVWVEISARVAEIHGRERLLMTVRDISNRKEREREHGRFRDLLDNATDSLFIIDPESATVLDANRTACEQLGYEYEELVGTSILDIEKNVNSFDYWTDFVDHLRESGAHLNEGAHRRRDGSTYPIETSVTLETHGDREYIVASARDITDRKEREQKLMAQNERLERFASVVSHDLRNPLNVATGYLSLLKAEYDGDSEHVERVERALFRMDDLISDLLEIARGEQSGGDLESVSLDVVATEAWQSVDAPDASLTVDIDETVVADPSRLGQLFENLYRNAVEHGGTEVHVHVEPLEDGTGFAVEDDGDGVPPAVRDRIFDDGFSTTEDGTGLGLSIVESVVSAHGWSVDLTDARSGGARFEISGVEFE